MLIGIIDYGVGNLQSVATMVDRLGVARVISAEPCELDDCAALILPGVGAFGAAMEKIRQSGLELWLKDWAIHREKPILGICLGMQLFANDSKESPDVEGLGFLDASVNELKPGKGTDNIGRPYFIPHMGWNSVTFSPESVLFRSIPGGSDFYFANSYHMVCKDESNVVGHSDHGHRFAVAVERNNIFGVQFHPEKSQKYGLKIVENFIAYTC